MTTHNISYINVFVQYRSSFRYTANLAIGRIFTFLNKDRKFTKLRTWRKKSKVKQLTVPVKSNQENEPPYTSTMSVAIHVSNELPASALGIISRKLRDG